MRRRRVRRAAVLVGILGLVVAVTLPTIRRVFAVARPSGTNALPNDPGRELGVLVVTTRTARVHGNMLAAILAAERSLPLSLLPKLFLSHLDLPSDLGDDPKRIETHFARAREVNRDRHFGLVVLQADLGRGTHRAIREWLGDSVPILLTNSWQIADSTVAELTSQPNTTAVLRGDVIREAVANIRRLRPQTKTIITLGDEGSNYATVRAHLQETAGPNIRLMNLVNPSTEQIERTIASAEGEAVLLLYPTRADDPDQTPFSVDAVLERFSETSPTAIFCLVTDDFRSYMVGGPMIDPRDMGQLVGDLGGKLLAGMSVADVPQVRMTTFRTIYSWETLNRLKIEMARLPANAQITGRFDALLRLFRTEVSVVTMVGVVLLVALLLINHERRQRRWSRSQLSMLTHRLLRTHDADKLRIARALHDDVAQDLAALSLFAEGLPIRSVAAAEDATADAGTAKTLAAYSTVLAGRIQRLIDDLHPTRLSLLPLDETLSRFADDVQRQHGLTVAVQCHAFRLEDREREVILFRLIEEAVENTVRHGSATTCAITLSLRDAATGLVEISDNGVGLPARTARASPQSLGLLHMRERASMLGGRVTVRSKRFAGTTVTLTVPLAHVS